MNVTIDMSRHLMGQQPGSEQSFYQMCLSPTGVFLWTVCLDHLLEKSVGNRASLANHMFFELWLLVQDTLAYLHPIPSSHSLNL